MIVGNFDQSGSITNPQFTHDIFTMDANGPDR